MLGGCEAGSMLDTLPPAAKEEPVSTAKAAGAGALDNVPRPEVENLVFHSSWRAVSRPHVPKRDEAAGRAGAGGKVPT